VTDSPTGFTYRERSWWLIDARQDPRKVVLAGLREAKLEGYTKSSHMGGTAEEVRSSLERAQMRRHQVVEAEEAKARRNVLPASEVNEFLRSLPEIPLS
jgi:hypothetical protein